MTRHSSTYLFAALAAWFALSACEPPEEPPAMQTAGTTVCNGVNDFSTVPAAYVTALTKYTTTNTVYTVNVCTQDADGDGTADSMVVESTGQPEHESVYFPSGNQFYEDFDYTTNLYKYADVVEAVSYTGTPHSAGTNKIAEYRVVMKMPISPAEAASKTATDYNTIGLALNGVSFFNENAAPGDEITDELFTFDQCSAHPQQEGVYHYHVDPVCLIRDLGGDVTTGTHTEGATTYTWLDDGGTNGGMLAGFLMDGFPVYMPVGTSHTDCNGDAAPAIGEYNGHTHCTEEFPDGIFHYHVKTGNLGGTAETIFWITNAVYYGTPGELGD